MLGAQYNTGYKGQRMGCAKGTPAHGTGGSRCGAGCPGLWAEPHASLDKFWQRRYDTPHAQAALRLPARGG